MAPPVVGYLWTPGYWGYNNGLYAFNQGYWGPVVGFYGGVNYGYGYGGYGYNGGRWENRVFLYNTAVTRVNTRVVHNTFVDRTALRRTTSSRASFNGPGGVVARATPQQLAAARGPHLGPTSVQRASRTAALRTAPARGQPATAARTFNGTPRTNGRTGNANGQPFNRPGASTGRQTQARTVNAVNGRAGQAVTQQMQRLSANGSGGRGGRPVPQQTQPQPRSGGGQGQGKTNQGPPHP